MRLLLQKFLSSLLALLGKYFLFLTHLFPNCTCKSITILSPSIENFTPLPKKVKTKTDRKKNWKTMYDNDDDDGKLHPLHMHCAHAYKFPNTFAKCVAYSGAKFQMHLQDMFGILVNVPNASPKCVYSRVSYFCPTFKKFPFLSTYLKNCIFQLITPRPASIPYAFYPMPDIWHFGPPRNVDQLRAISIYQHWLISNLQAPSSFDLSLPQSSCKDNLLSYVSTFYNNPILEIVCLRFGFEVGFYIDWNQYSNMEKARRILKSRRYFSFCSLLHIWIVKL